MGARWVAVALAVAGKTPQAMPRASASGHPTPGRRIAPLKINLTRQNYRRPFLNFLDIRIKTGHFADFTRLGKRISELNRMIHDIKIV